MRRIALALLVTGGLCACGQKGALYLPGEEREAVSTTPTETADATSATDEERERAAAARNNRPN
jgi:predicted small lipoprotein YifL